MFDYISFEEGVNIPIPDDMREFKNVQYQTKSLDCTMSMYFVGKDKCLYLNEDKHFEESNPELLPLPAEGKKNKINYHGIINFYSYEMTDVTDYCCDYQAKFTDGILENIKLINFKKIDHESVSLRRERFLEKQRLQNKKISTRLIRSVKKIFLSIFELIGIENIRIYFHKPEILFLYTPKQKNYGLFFDKISTGFYLKTTKFNIEFSCRLLGLGFSIVHSKPFSFELCDE